MSNFQDKLANYNSGLKYYVIVPVTKCLGEDGRYMEDEFAGYGIMNTQTNVVEHTTICLPAALYQATHFDDMLVSLLSKKAPSLTLVEKPADDILPH